jgi:predicted nucleic acid-binding protein
MNKVFFDTWGWVAVANESDAYHVKVVDFYRDFLLKGGMPVTSDYVLSETITLLRARTNPKDAGIFIDTILEAAGSGRVRLEWIDQKKWEKAWQMCKKYADKPGISFVDFTSFLLMKESGIMKVLTADRHFEEVGLRFEKLF